MQIHNLKPKHKRKKAKRVGRGGKRGTYSGRGIKGQKSREGGDKLFYLKEWIKKYHKLRGYRFGSLKKETIVLNLKDIEKKFEDGQIVSSQTLLQKGLIDKIKGRIPEVKILGDGKITKKIIVKNCKLSESAKKKIKKAGGKIF